MALLCVSQIIPTLVDQDPLVMAPLGKERRAGEVATNRDSSILEKPPQPANGSVAEEHLAVELVATSQHKENQDSSVTAALALLSPLLISCMDDDWNADVRALAVTVLRQLFLDLQVSPHRS